MRAVRDNVADHLLRSVQLWKSVAELPEYRSAQSVLAFASVKGEVDTDPLFARVRQEERRLLLPRVEGDRLVVAEGVEPFVRSSFGVPEPQGDAVDLTEVDLVIVPGLAFTADGHRLGYGGGFYDRFLLSAAAPSIGVCFAEQIVEYLPLDAHDTRVGRVVSA